MNRMDYATHVKVLAWIDIGFSALISFVGLFGLVFLLGIGAVADDPEASRILGFVGFAGAAFLVALALPGFVAGYGLLKRRRWGRFLAIVVAVLDLFEIPVGTAIGFYGLWVLSGDEAGAYFKSATESPAG
jgi:hypothetical protein